MRASSSGAEQGFCGLVRGFMVAASSFAVEHGLSLQASAVAMCGFSGCSLWAPECWLGSRGIGLSHPVAVGSGVMGQGLVALWPWGQ